MSAPLCPPHTPLCPGSETRGPRPAPSLSPGLRRPARQKDSQGIRKATGSQFPPAGPGLEVQNWTLKVPCRSQHLLNFHFLPQTRNHIFGSIRLTRPFTLWKAKCAHENAMPLKHTAGQLFSMWSLPSPPGTPNPEGTRWSCWVETEHKGTVHQEGRVEQTCERKEETQT